MVAEIIIVTEHGEMLVSKRYKFGLNCHSLKFFVKKSHEIKLGLLPPYFEDDGVHCYYIHRQDIYFFATDIKKLPIIYVLEFLNRLYQMAKDLIGDVTEVSVRANFFQVFEILCEVMDGGSVQVTSSKELRHLIHSRVSPAMAPTSSLLPANEVVSYLFGIDNQAYSPPLSNRFSSPKLQENSIYVDIQEFLTADIDDKGQAFRLDVDGNLIIRSSIIGQSILRLALNKNLHVSKSGEAKAYGRSSELEHLSLHEQIDNDEFESNRIILMSLYEGEFSAMKYKVSPSFVTIPINIDVAVHTMLDSKDVTVKIMVSPRITTSMKTKACPNEPRLEYLKLCLPLPETIARVSQMVEGPSELLKFDIKSRCILWTIRSLPNGDESQARLRLIADKSTIDVHKIGPATVELEIDNISLSGMQICSLKVLDSTKTVKEVNRFVRSAVKSLSFTVATSLTT